MSTIPRLKWRNLYTVAAVLAAFFLAPYLDGPDVFEVDAAVAEEATQAPSEAARQARVERAMQIAEAAR